MDFEPQKFFIGVIDFFSVLLPGALLTYVGKDCTASLLFGLPGFPLEGAESWMIFLFSAYVLGHILFLLGSALDVPYDWLRDGTALGQIKKRLAKNKAFSLWPRRRLARLLFGKDPDSSVAMAVRIKSRALAALEAGGAVNAFQWCKAQLSKDHPEGLVAVQRLEADSKFFRSFAVVLVLLTVACYFQQNWLLGNACLLLLLPTLWRYMDERFKATQQAYWFVITLEAMKLEPAADPARPSGYVRDRAGGVVYKGSNPLQYLLVKSSDCKSWVLPKGHIEWGEEPRYTAIREVHEETGVWGKIVVWLEDVHLESAPESPWVRFFLMEMVEEPKEWPGEKRQHRWLSLEAAKKETLFPEIEKLLEDAEQRLKAARQSST